MSEPAALQTPPRRGKRLGPLRLVLRLLAGIGLVVLVLVVSLLCFALFPPSDLLRRAALPIAQKALNHDNLHIGSLVLRPLSHIELQDLWLGPPVGYSEPMFTVRRIVVRHDLSQILSGQVTVRQVLVERPVIRVESRQGKLNWIAFLERLPKSEPEPEPEEEPSEPSDLRILVDQVSVIGFGAHVDDGVNQLSLDSLHLALWGAIQGADRRLKLVLGIEGRHPGQASLAVLHKKPKSKELGGRLDTRLDVEVALHQRPTPLDELRPNVNARVDVGLDVASRQLKAPWPLDPIRLGVRLGLTADTAEDQALLQRLQVVFNDSELLRLRGTVSRLFANQQLRLLLAKLHLPLDKLAPYARAVAPEVDFGGHVRVTDLRLGGTVKELAAGTGLPKLDGTLELEKIWAKVLQQGPKGLTASLEDLNLKLAFSTQRKKRPLARTRQAIRGALPSLELEPTTQILDQSEGPFPSVMVLGQIRLGEARAQGAVIKDLDLRLSTGAFLKGTAPQSFANHLSLNIPSISYRLPRLGAVRLGLRTDLLASGDLPRQEMVLERLKLDLPGLLGLRVSARAEELGNKSFSADVELLPMRLAQLVRRAPPGIRAKLGGLRLAGKLGLKVKVSGKRPDPMPKDPFSLPVTLDTKVSLFEVGAQDLKRNLKLAGLDGTITIKGRPADLRLLTDLRVASMAKPDIPVQLSGVKIDEAVHIRPNRIQAKVGATIARFAKKDMGLSVKGFGVEVEADSALSLRRIVAGGPPVLGKTTLKVRHKISGGVRMATAGNALSTGPLENGLDLSYLPSGGGAGALKVRHFTHLASLTQPGTQVKGLKVANTVSLPIPLQRLLAGRPAVLDHIKGRLDLDLGSVRIANQGLTAGPLKSGVDYSYEASRARQVHVHQRTQVAAVTHRRQKARLRGLTIDHRSQAAGLVLRLPKPVVDVKSAATQLKLVVEGLTKKGFPPLRNTWFELDAVASNRLSDLKLRKVALRMPSNGLYLDLSGMVRDVRRPKVVALPPFDLKLSTGLKNPRTHQRKIATLLAPGVKSSGKLGLIVRAKSSGGRRLSVDGRLVAHGFNLWTRGVALEPREPEGYTRKVTLLTLKDLSADLPLSQEVDLNLLGPRPWALPPPKRSIFAKQAASVLYKTLRPYTGRRSKLVIGGIEIDERLAALNRDGHLISTARRRNKINKLSLDLAVGDSTLLLNRLYVKLFSGDIAGSVHGQLLDPLKPDIRTKLRLQVTGVNLAYLDPAAKERTAKTEVSALMELKYELCAQYLEGRISITQLSLDMLDSLLAYLDPNKVNESVQKNRKMLKAWYVKMANPTVKLVSIWINHGNLNLDIEMDAMAPVGTIIKRNLRNNRIRRLNILPFLPKCRGSAKAASSPESEKESGP